MKTQTPIQVFLPSLNLLEVASVIHCASEAIRHGCSFSRAYCDLGVTIPALNSTEEDCDWISEKIEDLRDTKELVNLITMASFKLQTLSS